MNFKSGDVINFNFYAIYDDEDYTEFYWLYINDEICYYIGSNKFFPAVFSRKDFPDFTVASLESNIFQGIIE